MSPKRIYYKPSKEVSYGPSQPTNGAALHQLRIRSVEKHCQRLGDDNACCSAAEVLKRMRADEFWSTPVTATKSIEVPKATRAFQTVGVIECAAPVAAVVRLMPDAQPGDLRLWVADRLKLCSGCAAHRVDVFRLDESETAAALACDTEEQLKVRKGAKKGDRYANQHKVWEMHLRCLFDEPGAVAEQILLKDLSRGGGSRLISNTLSADMSFPDAADEAARQQLVDQHIDAILDGHTRSVLRFEIGVGLHPTLREGSWLAKEIDLPSLSAANIRAWGLAGMSADQYERCIALGMRYQTALQLQRERLEWSMASILKYIEADSADKQAAAVDGEFSADDSVIGADADNNDEVLVAAAAGTAAADDDESMEPGELDDIDDSCGMPSSDFMDILYDMLEEERAAKRSRAERDS
eukprot:3034-Heterococcus_DN1.PRE.2